MSHSLVTFLGRARVDAATGYARAKYRFPGEGAPVSETPFFGMALAEHLKPDTAVIADAVPNGEVSFDLTHGFRHLGMVGFMSAFMLEQVRSLRVRGLWYGAHDMKDPTSGVTPVLRLDGLTRVRRWLGALDKYDASGDYGVFSSLLIEDGVAEDKAACLERAAFYERTLNLADAARQIRTFLPILDTPPGGCVGLVQEPACGTSPLGHDGKSGRPSAKAGLRVLETPRLHARGRVPLGSARHTGMRAARTSRR